MKSRVYHFVYGLLLCAQAIWGQSAFTKVTSGEIVTDLNHSYGCAWVDFDDDGFLDLFVANGFGENNCLYRNLGDGAFEKHSQSPLATDLADACAGVWADYDNDGDTDLFVTNFESPVKDMFYRNHGDGTFERILEGAWVNDSSAGVVAAWGDYDNDGYVDLVIANSLSQRKAQFHNNRDGTMEQILTGAIPQDAGQNGCLIWGDYDGDGDLDLYLGGNPQRGGQLFQNEGTGTFARIAGPGTAGYFCGAAWADVNNDGLPDLFVARGGSAVNDRNDLFWNSPLGGFEKLTEGEIVNTASRSVGCAWGDYDNDGYLDLYVANDAGQNNELYHNEGDGTFVHIQAGDILAVGANTWGCAWGDYDNDGDLDLFVTAGGAETTSGPKQANLLYRNDGSTNAWSLVKLIGTVSNRSAIGAKVRARAMVRGQELWQLREVSGGSGYCSQNDLRAHFGLGDATKVDTLRIEWPSGTVQELHNVAANQILTVTEPPRLIPQAAGKFQIRCWINQSLEVQCSSDLSAWTPVTTVTNESGTLIFEDVEADQHECRYYRVIEARPNMVWIPTGTFLMGTPENEQDRQDNEGPQTQVTLTKGFWIGKYEVTQGEYLEVIGNNPSHFDGGDYGTDLNRPVESVSWDDAVAYCAALTERERTAGRIPMSYAFRLPTEAEWEYACRAGTTTRFSYGNDPNYTELANHAWYYDNSNGQTHPVGQKLPNPWGLYDMHGNVWEWCRDWWAENLPGGLVLDPQGPETGSYRVIRGGDWGGWGVDAWSCRSAKRGYGLPEFRFAFRAVLAPDQP